MSAYQRPVPGPASTVPLCPEGVYRVYCPKVKTSRSKASGNLMSEVSVQILSPDVVTLPDGPKVQTAGLEGRFYIVYANEVNKRGEHKMVATLDVLSKLGVTLPEASPDFETEASNFAAAVEAHLVNLTWEMVVKSKREPKVDMATREPMKDSAGNLILGPEQVDFNTFNIVGLPKSITDLGVAPAAY